MQISSLVSSIWFGNDNKYLDNLKYKYDEKGNITEVYENSMLVARYKYDSLSRLIREDNKPLNKTVTWEYDAGGNIFKRFEYEFTTANDLNEKTPTIIPYSYASSGIRDRLISYGNNADELNSEGVQFEYDAIGNPETYRGKTFKWSHGRQLDEIGIVTGEEYTKLYDFKYNANGIRIAKENVSINTKTEFYLDGTKILAQKDIVNASGTPVQTLMQFLYGVDGIIGFTLNGTNYYYKKNLQGDIIGIYDNNLQIIAKYDYDAWGNHKISYLDYGNFVDFTDTNSYNDTSNNNLYIALKNPFRYRGYYYDNETKLYYLNSRYYDPEIGRFINIDDISIINESKDILNGLNLFIYCNDNPVMFTDTTGKGWWSDLWDKIRNVLDVFAGVVISAIAVIGGVIINVISMGSLSFIGNTLIGAGVGGLINGIISKSNGGSFWGGYLGGAITGALTGLGLSLGPLGAMIGGTLGNFFGTMVTDTINGIDVSQNNYLINLAAESLLSGIISIGAFKFGELIKIFNIPGFRDVYAGMTVWAEFSFNALFNETKKVVHLMAEYLRKLFNIRI